MSAFRLGLLNPNTSQADTDAMASLIVPVLPADAVVVSLTAASGYAAIEGDVEHVDGAGQVLTLMRSAPALDAYLIGCFDDPALHAGRELTAAPVVGIGEAAYAAAAMVGRRFAVVTTLRRGIPALEDAIAAQGHARHCVGVLALDRGVRDQNGEAAIDAIVAVARGAIDELSADAIVLACGAMAASSAAVSSRLGAPVCDGVAFGALTAYALWATGLGTSKVNAYGWPPTAVSC